MEDACSSTAPSTSSPTSIGPRPPSGSTRSTRSSTRVGRSACALPARPAHGTGARQGRRRPVDGADRLHQHDPARAGAVVPGRRVRRAPHPRVHPLERGDDGRPREPPLRRARRSPLHVRVGGVAVRGRLQPLLPRQGRRRLRRPGVLPGPRRARHLRRARSSKAGSPRTSSTTSGARSAAAACRRTRTRGACRTSGSSRPCRWGSARSTRCTRRGSTATSTTARSSTRPTRACGASSATARWTSPKSMAALSLARARAPRQPDLRRELQPATARRSGARQRQGHPGVRVDRSAAWAGT